MSDLNFFLKKNKKEQESKKFAATKSICDADGNPVEWEFKAIKTSKDEQIRKKHTKEIPTGKRGQYRTKVDFNAYMDDLIVESCVYPDLYDAKLQDSYGVMNPVDLLHELVDNVGEYQDLAIFVQQLNGFDVDINEEVETAKN